MIGAMRPLVIDLRSVFLGLDAGLVQRCVESAALGRPGLIGGGQLPGVRGRAVFTQSRLLCSLRGSALRSVKGLPLTGTGAG